MTPPPELDLSLGSCPLPHASGEVELVQGAGGEASRRLIDELFVRELDDVLLVTDCDAASFEAPARPGRWAFTTDSFVVSPIEFPGGDIGSLSVFGTVNDLAVSGAEPLYLSAAFILEEGLPLEALRRVVRSMRRAARDCGVNVLTGDTKVVERGKGDGVYVNTSGVGWIDGPRAWHPRSVREGDAILVSGDVGRHGLSILALRDGLRFARPIESDCGSIAATARALRERGVRVHCMRDPTRGGVASALVEVAESARVDMELEEIAIPVRRDVAAGCELLGLDPLVLASEGRLLCWVPEDDAGAALDCLRAFDASAARVGTCGKRGEGRVSMRTEIGTLRWVERPSGLPLPRIC